MQTTLNKTDSTTNRDPAKQSDATLINLAAHRQTKHERFADVEDLIDRLTYDTVNVANGGYRTS